MWTNGATQNAKAFNITASAGTGGVIDAAGTISVTEGTSQVFNITPHAGYQVKDVVVDGQSQGALTSYTFNVVTANHTIDATFAAAPVIPKTADTHLIVLIIAAGFVVIVGSLVVRLQLRKKAPHREE